MTLRISSLACFSATHVLIAYVPFLGKEVHFSCVRCGIGEAFSSAQSYAASNCDAQDVLVSALQQDVALLADLGPFHPPF